MAHGAHRATDAPALVRLWPVALGLVILVALWAGPLPGRARVSFSSHMILHLGVMVVAAPLLALGVARTALMPEGRGSWIPFAILASVAELVLVWAWHAPALHEAAGLVPWVFALQQASFLFAGLLVWLPGLAPGREAAGAGALAMLMSFMHMSMLGMLLTTVPALLYAPELCLGGFGLGPLEDQQLGGVLMAVGGGLPYLAGAVVFAHRLLTGPVR